MPIGVGLLLMTRGNSTPFLVFSGATTIEAGASATLTLSVANNPGTNPYDGFAEVTDADGIASLSGSTITLTTTSKLGAHTITYKATSSGGRPDISASTVVTIQDTTAPTLSSPSASVTGATTATLSVSSNEGSSPDGANGTLYTVVSTNSSTPTAAQVIAGKDSTGAAGVFTASQAVSATGSQSVSATGLTAVTTYYAYFVQKDSVGNTSTVAATSSFTTSSPSTNLLDSITGISAVWSFRRLLSAYAGNCVKIRRSSDNTTQNFGFISDVVDTSGIASFIGAGSGFIDTWYDQSGNGLNLTQATTANQPSYNASATNSLPAVDNSGGGTHYLQIASLDVTAKLVATNAFTFMDVANNNAGGNQNQLFWDSSGGGTNRLALYWTLSTNIRTDFANANVDGTLSDTKPVGYDGNPHVNETYHNSGGTMDNIVDGTSAGSDTGHNSSLSAGTSTLFLMSGDFGFAGSISEVIMANVALSSTDRATIRKNGTGSGAGQKSMGTYFGITVT